MAFSISDVRHSVGLGYSFIELDVTAPLIDLPTAATMVELIVVDPDDNESQYEVDVSGIAAADSGLTDAQMFTAVVSGLVEDETHTYFKVLHPFLKRGKHRASVRFWFLSSEWVSTADALIIFAGDGLIETARI